MNNTPAGFHRHPNGGGLVQDTAHVEASAFVGPNAQVAGDAQVTGDAQVAGNAQVSGNVWVYGDARVFGNVRVFGNAQVSGDAQVFGNAWDTSPPYFPGSRHAMTLGSFTTISIGCHTYPIQHWLEHYQAIGRAEGYTKAQIAEYGMALKMFAALAKFHQKKARVK